MTLQNGDGHSSSPEQRLCLACGLCCNGVLFRDVELQDGDDPARLQELGLPLKIRTGKKQSAKAAQGPTLISTPQPCAGLLGCRCTLYNDRPLRCRQFDCALLIQMRSGEKNEEQALQIIRATRNSATKVNRLLAELGDQNEKQALSLRFQRIRRHMESSDSIGEEEAAVYADLTLAVHDLQHRLGKHFYP